MRATAMIVAGVALALAGCTASDPIESAPDPWVSASAEQADAATAATAAPLPGEEPPGPVADREPTETEGPGSIGSKELPTTEIDEGVEIERGLTVLVTSVDDVEIDAQGPGEVSGPGKAIRVELRNESGDAVDLGGVVVGLTIGDEPAIESFSPPTDPFMGRLGTGDRARATYAFLLPEGASGTLVVRVEYSGSDNAVVVTL